MGTYEEVRQMLHDYGWELDCWSPLEISMNDEPGSRASGEAALIVIAQMEEDSKNEVKVPPIMVYDELAEAEKGPPLKGDVLLAHGHARSVTAPGGSGHEWKKKPSAPSSSPVVVQAQPVLIHPVKKPVILEIFKKVATGQTNFHWLVVESGGSRKHEAKPFTKYHDAIKQWSTLHLQEDEFVAQIVRRGSWQK